MWRKPEYDGYYLAQWPIAPLYRTIHSLAVFVRWYPLWILYALGLLDVNWFDYLPLRRLTLRPWRVWARRKRAGYPPVYWSALKWRHF